MMEKFPYLTVLDRLSIKETVKVTDIITGLWTGNTQQIALRYPLQQAADKWNISI